MTKIDLEIAIDKHGLCAVLEAIAEICDAKAEHITASYDDGPLARHWQRAAFIVSAAGASVTKRAGGVQVGHDKGHSLPE